MSEPTPDYLFYEDDDHQAIYNLMMDGLLIIRKPTGNMTHFGFEDIDLDLYQKSTGFYLEATIYRKLGAEEMASKSREMFEQLNAIHKAQTDVCEGAQGVIG